jgi:hypothetical protein
MFSINKKKEETVAVYFVRKYTAAKFAQS